MTGRDEELALVAGAVRTGPVVVGGGAGVGKTRLLRDWADGTGGPVARVTATSATATIPFGAFAAWVPDHLDAAAEQLGALRTITEGVAATASCTFVDDAHLLDAASAALVLHLATHGGLSVVATVRTGEPVPDAVAALWRDGIGTRVDLLPLSRAEVERLVAARLEGRVDPVVRDRIWALSAGNPMFVRELVEGALADGALCDEGGTWRWSGPVPVAPRLVEVVEQRLDHLDAPDRRLLEVVARGEPVPLEVLARIGEPDQIDELVRRDLLSALPGDAAAIGLVHPLYSEVLRAATPALADRQHCADLVRATLAAEPADGDGGVDPLRVAVWAVDGDVADAPPDLLLDGAQRAVARRDDELGLRLAAAVLPTAADHPTAGAAAALLVARCLAELGRDDEHHRVVDDLLGHDDPGVRAAAAEMRAFHHLWADRDTIAAREVLDAALEATAAPHDAALAASAATFACYELDLDRTIELCARASSSATAPSTRLIGLTLAGQAAALRGEAAPATAVIEHLLADVLAVAEVDPVPPAWAATGFYWARSTTGGTDAAEAFFSSVLDSLDLVQQRAFRALPMLILGRLRADQGRVGSAAELLRDAADLLGHDSRYWFGRPSLALSELAVASAQAGDPDAAEEALDAARRRVLVATRYARHHLLRAEAWAAAARGELGRAAELAMAGAELAHGHGARALDLVSLADATRLGAHASAAPRLRELAAALGPQATTAAGWARFAQALVDGDGTALDQASVDLEALGHRLAAAEAAAVAAVHHGRDGLRRREAAARDRAAMLCSWCGPVRTPLLLTHDLRPVADDLTTREREVALLAAAGRTNREAAAILGVSVRTVHSHLNHAYTKLGTSERDELRRLLGADAPEGTGAR